MINIQCVLSGGGEVKIILTILKLVSWDPGRGVRNIWRKASFFQLPRVYFQTLFLHFKALAFSVVRSVCNVNH